MSLLRVTPALLVSAMLAAAAPDEPPPRGMDVIPLVRAASEALRGSESPVPGRPWSDELAALTNSDPATNGPAIGSLVRRGAAVLDDLAVLATDRDWQVRSRVVRVAAGIGGTAGAPLCLRLSSDHDPRVRRIATVGLGRCRGDDVVKRLLEILISLDPDERANAASSLAAVGSVQAIKPLCHLRADPDTPARQAQAQALAELVRRSDAATVTTSLLQSLTGAERQALLEAVDGCVDTRLCLPLSALVSDREALTSLLAVRALSSAGDARAVEPLVALAASERLPELREAAAETLRNLTGYRAGPGQAWTLWWRDNAGRFAALAQRDARIAELMDPAAPLPDFSGYSLRDLAPLIDGAVASTHAFPAWYPPRALAALRRLSDKDWASELGSRIDAANDGEARLDLILLLDEIGGANAVSELQRLKIDLERRQDEALKAWEDKGVAPPDMDAERALLDLCLARRAR